MRPVIEPGPWLLRNPDPSLETHRSIYAPVTTRSTADLVAIAERAAVRGRGGAGFPVALKLRTVSEQRGRKHVVVNLSEGEPASAKDGALVLTAPHLILDGAELVARALGVHQVHLTVPEERAWVTRSLERAIRERDAGRGRAKITWTFHSAAARFVSGEASAVTELIDGRTNLPVTSWVPTAYAGVRGQPTFLSNAETYAQLAALTLDPGNVPGTAEEPGTRLLSLSSPVGPIRVVEVPHGTPWRDVLSPEQLARPVLIGGYHGMWVAAGALTTRTVTAADLSELGVGLGAGVVIPLAEGECPVRRTGVILNYLAGQSARRCGPCFRGLPALAAAFDELLHGEPLEPVLELVGLVQGRGACAHPDGTARLVRSAVTSFGPELEAHAHGRCQAQTRVPMGAARWRD